MPLICSHNMFLAYFGLHGLGLQPDMVSVRLANDDSPGRTFYYGHVVRQPHASILRIKGEQANETIQNSLLTHISHDCTVLGAHWQ